MRHVKIPAGWSSEEALAVATFLEDVIRAVWRQHGKKIFDELSDDDAELGSDPTVPSPAEPPDDTLPF